MTPDGRTERMSRSVDGIDGYRRVSSIDNDGDEEEGENGGTGTGIAGGGGSSGSGGGLSGGNGNGDDDDFYNAYADEKKKQSWEDSPRR